MGTRFLRFHDYDDSSSSELLLKIVLFIAVPLLGISAGLVASTGNWKIVALIGAVIVGLTLAMLPRVIFWITVVASILVVDAVRMYFPAGEGVRWLVPFGAWLLAGYAAAHVYLPYVSGANDRMSQSMPKVAAWAFAFVVVTLISSFIHWPGAETFFKGMKGYFQMWGLLFALMFFPWPKDLIEKLPKFFLIAAFIQLPFVVHQFLVLVPKRVNLGEGVVAVDIISGTFGGVLEGGGNNAVLSTFLMIVFAGLLSAWRQGVMSLTKVLSMGLLLLVPVALNVSKISIVYAAVVFFVLFGQDVLRRPGRFLATTLIFVGVIGLLATAYTLFAPKELHSWQDLIEYTYEGNMEKDRTHEGELTRGGALRYWLENQSWKTLPETFFGYGPGTTRAEDEGGGSNLDDGPVDPELQVGRLAITAILWEGGVLSIICVFGLFYSGYTTAGKLARECVNNPKRRAVFYAIQAGIAVMFVSLWHKHFFVFHIGFQTIFALLFGYLGYWVRFGQTGEDIQLPTAETKTSR